VQTTPACAAIIPEFNIIITILNQIFTNQICLLDCLSDFFNLFEKKDALEHQLHNRVWALGLNHSGDERNMLWAFGTRAV
jgi:hypothetical protein